ncbi:hypothetical protein FRACA_1480014 [Frankia canadensis]|uniref:FxLD family lantipeptide n=1 Tax=Frankia canadensis TaxID=1836972 RepID=A0A2I2KLT7_9ACTN|nr:FxLD family lanthipeptide [Frankia canadensis]SNQ46606.1 hypothetical protein FRACA_1480014 [Frankia canadensis]SOU53896.1 hypothetical protein FRACA_1480014 [Frankia canadensis]
MSTSELATRGGAMGIDDGLFDLDIRVIEVGDAAASLINLTDDGCGSTCPKACATNCG